MFKVVWALLLYICVCLNSPWAWSNCCPQELWYKEDYAIVSSAMPYATPYESINSGCTSFLLPIGCSGLAVLSKFPIVEASIHPVLDWRFVLIVNSIKCYYQLLGQTRSFHPSRKLLEIWRGDIRAERCGGGEDPVAREDYRRVHHPHGLLLHQGEPSLANANEATISISFNVKSVARLLITRSPATCKQWRRYVARILHPTSQHRSTLDI